MPYMKAESYINGKTGQPEHTITGWYSTEKFDGQRAQWDPVKCQLISRYGNVVSAPPWFLSYFDGIKHRLDGELFMGYGSWDLTGIFRSKRKDPDELMWRRVKYMIFDVVCEGDYDERYRVLQNLILKPPLHLIERTRIESRAHLQEIYSSTLQRGGEGLVLYNPHGLYKDGRTDNILKYKPVLDDQCIVVGYKPGNGRNAGRLGSFIVHPIEDGEPVPQREFSISGINDTIRSNYRTSHPIGTILNYRCSELTKSGKPRFPRYLGICRKPIGQLNQICAEPPRCRSASPVEAPQPAMPQPVNPAGTKTPDITTSKNIIISYPYQEVPYTPPRCRPTLRVIKNPFLEYSRRLHQTES